MKNANLFQHAASLVQRSQVRDTNGYEVTKFEFIATNLQVNLWAGAASSFHKVPDRALVQVEIAVDLDNADRYQPDVAKAVRAMNPYIEISPDHQKAACAVARTSALERARQEVIALRDRCDGNAAAIQAYGNVRAMLERLMVDLQRDDG